MYILTHNKNSISHIFSDKNLEKVEEEFIKDVGTSVLESLTYAYQYLKLKVTDEHLLKLIIRSKMCNRFIIEKDDKGVLIDLTDNYSKNITMKNMPYRKVSIIFKDESVLEYCNWHECFIDSNFIDRVKAIHEERFPSFKGVENVSVSGVNGNADLRVSIPNKKTLNKLLGFIKSSEIYENINNRG